MRPLTSVSKRRARRSLRTSCESDGRWRERSSIDRRERVRTGLDEPRDGAAPDSEIMVDRPFGEGAGQWAVERSQLPELPINERKLREFAVCVALGDWTDLQAILAFSRGVTYRFTRERSLFETSRAHRSSRPGGIPTLGIGANHRIAAAFDRGFSCRYVATNARHISRARLGGQPRTERR
jgi:hypothetical protein